MNIGGRARDSSSRPPSASTSARASASPSPVDEPTDTPRSNTCGTSSSGTPAPGVGDLDEQAVLGGRALSVTVPAPCWMALSTSAPTASRSRAGRDPGQQPVRHPDLERAPGRAQRRAPLLGDGG